MHCAGDFTSSTIWAKPLWGHFFGREPQLHPNRLRVMLPPLLIQPRCPWVSLGCWALLQLTAEEKLGKGKVGGSATELINSFKKDGELTLVYIKGQGNECRDEGTCNFKCIKLINK